MEPGRHLDSFYKFAVIRPSKYNTDIKVLGLVLFNNLGDTSGHELKIVKNELNKATKSREEKSILQGSVLY